MVKSKLRVLKNPKPWSYLSEFCLKAKNKEMEMSEIFKLVLSKHRVVKIQAGLSSSVKRPEPAE